jgi:cobyrinic acid a,c-diamide synthase
MLPKGAAYPSTLQVPFCPVYGSELPEADIVYLPGGYPELFARQLHRRKRLMEQLREYVEKGGKLLAEGGGMALLGQTLTARPGGTAYEMAGILPYSVIVKDNRPCSGYRQTHYRDLCLKGYEYRYFDIVPTEEAASLQTPVCNLKGGEVSGSFFFRYKNCIATSVHHYWGETGLYKLWE